MLKAATLRDPAILRLWWQRACFRAQLRADIESATDFLRDVGINMVEAKIEAARFFWEPVMLTRRQFVADAAFESGVTLWGDDLDPDVGKDRVDRLETTS